MAEKTTQQIIDELISTITGIVGTEKITISNVLSICINLMQIVEKYSSLTGAQKKDIVIKTLENLIEKEEGKDSIMLLIPDFIDKIISVENGEIHIGISVEAVQSCCFGVSSCTKKK